MYKYFLYFAAILKARLLRERVPIMVTVCVTGRCNMRCRYCYAGHDQPDRHLPAGRLLALIDELADLGTRYVSINGGESLLRHDLAEVIGRIKARKILCHLSTNGLLIPSRVALLKDVDSLAVSLDGDEESNDRNRGPGTYKRIMAGLECLKREKVNFHLHTVLTRNNKDAVEQMLALAKRLGVQVQFSLLREEDSPDPALAMDVEELKDCINRILAYKKKGAPAFFSAEAYDNFLSWPVSYQQQTIQGRLPQGFRPGPCYLKRFACHIEPNGDVYPCIVLVNKFKPLNFLEVGFKRCWDHLEKNPCLACHNVCSNDLNHIFSLRSGSILNAARIVWERLNPPGT